MTPAEANIEDRHEFPPKPEEPLDSDCCGNGCVQCVFDIYKDSLKKWRLACDKIRAREVVSRALCVSQLQQTHYRLFRIEAVTQVTDDTFLYRFHVPDNGIIGLDIGQHIILKAEVNGRVITRQYTPVSAPNLKGFFDVVIKIYSDGIMSKFVKEWKVGDTVPWRGPFGDFNYSPNSYRHVVLLCAGTGIAPMVQIIRHIVENEDDETFVYLHYCCRKYSDILCKPLLRAWTSSWNFTVQYHLSQEVEGESQVQYGDQIQYGRLGCDKLTRLLKPLDSCTTLVVICGTKSFDEDMIKCMKEIGFHNYFKF